MTVEEVEKRVEEIAAIVRDNEVAHSKEDSLYVNVLEWIAGHGDENSAALAKAALKTEELKFTRWTG